MEEVILDLNIFDEYFVVYVLLGRSAWITLNAKFERQYYIPFNKHKSTSNINKVFNENNKKINQMHKVTWRDERTSWATVSQIINPR